MRIFTLAEILINPLTLNAMKRINILIIFILLFHLSCKKKHSDIIQAFKFTETRYKIYDSIIRVIDNMNGGVVTQEYHYPLNRF